MSEREARGVAQLTALPRAGQQGAGLESRKTEKADLAPPAGQDVARPVDASRSETAASSGYDKHVQPETTLHNVVISAPADSTLRAGETPPLTAPTTGETNEASAAGGSSRGTQLEFYSESSAPRVSDFPESGDRDFTARSRTSGDAARSVTLAGRGAVQGSGAAVGTVAVTEIEAHAPPNVAGRSRGTSQLVNALLVNRVGADSVRPRSEHCPDYRRGLAFYIRRANDWRAKMGAGARATSSPSASRDRASCPRVRYLASRWRTKAYAARRAYERWAAIHVLRDPEVRPGNNAWEKAVQRVQRVFPNTQAWLLSCSAAEGGHGRFVYNSQGSGAAGWLQYMPGTFAGFIWKARADAERRGFIVPPSAASLFSPLGQALAGAWALQNSLKHHWVGSGCG